MERSIRVVGGFFLLLLPFATATPGFISTFSKALYAGETENVYVTLFDCNSGVVKVGLTVHDGNQTKTIAEVSQVVDKPCPLSGQIFKVSLPVPESIQRYTRANLWVNGSMGSYSFGKKTQLSVNINKNHCYVQPDKPIYKPAEVVKFRILTLDSHLKPIGGEVVTDAWMENPDGIRVAQWKNISSPSGMSQFEMPLSEDPSLGQWTIFVNSSLVSKSIVCRANVQVQQYVLPKFEVTVTPPSYSLINSDSITWTICGSYTYGKPVKGKLAVESTYNRQNYYWDHTKYPKLYAEQEIHGCTNHTIFEKDFGWKNSSFRYTALKVFARITEDGTDEERNGTGTLSLTTNPFQLSFVDPTYEKGYFKQGFPCTGKLQVQNPDKTKRSGELIQICAMASSDKMSAYNYQLNTDLFCKNFSSDSNGLVHFTIPPSPQPLLKWNIQADAVNFPTQKFSNEYNGIINQPSTSIELKPWHSLSPRSILILPVEETVLCGSTHQFTVYFNGDDNDQITLYSQIMSRDGIVSQEVNTYKYSSVKSILPTDDTYVKDSNTKTEMGIITLSVKITQEMSPKGYLLVYYTTDDGEVIADSIQFDISKCLKNKVNMKFSNEKQEPESNINVEVTASPNSLCGISAVDKSVSLISSSNNLDIDKVFQALNDYGSNRFGYFSDESDCVPQKDPSQSSFSRRRRSAIVPPGKMTVNSADAQNAFQFSKFSVMTDKILVTKPCLYSGRHYPYPVEYDDDDVREESEEYEGESLGVAGGMAPGASMKMMMADAGVPLRSPNKEEEVVRQDFPETWLWEMFTVPEAGKVVTTKQLPDTITEWVGNAVCVHPTDGLGVSPPSNVTAIQPFFVSMDMPYSVIRGERFPLPVTVFNYLENTMAVTIILDDNKAFSVVGDTWETTLCVNGSDSATHQFLVEKTTIGHINFTVHALTDPKSKVCGQNVETKVIARDAITQSLIVEAEGFKHQETFSTFICPSDTNGKSKVSYELVARNDSVPDSIRAEAFVSGDLMGAAIHNIERLVQMPTGCGEQNMLNFAPDIFVLDYLTKTDSLTPDLESKLLGYLKKGYQRELTYRHMDGSYSAFGEEDSSGSMWLSAFVLKGFGQASKFCDVDKTEIQRTLMWIVNNQNRETGCFPEIGEVHDSAIKGGYGGNSSSPSALASYILISLLESGAIKNETFVQKALQCITKDTNPTIYTMALMTYARLLADDHGAYQQLDNLMKLRKAEGDTAYWEDDFTKNPALQGEIEGYVILSLLKAGGRDNLPKCLPIVRRLLKKQNANGGFISTQDTVIALQALAEYASYIPNHAKNIGVQIESTGVSKSFHVNEENKLLLQSTVLPQVPATVTITANGTDGCFLSQVNLMYNIPTPPGSQAFHLDISAVKGVEKNCKIALVTACMSYENQNRVSNMAVLEMRIPSGYEVDQDSLQQLKTQPNLHFKRGDIKGSDLALYFSKRDSKKICFSFKINQNMEVQNSQGSVATLFDYYEPENQISQLLKMEEKCEL